MIHLATRKWREDPAALEGDQWCFMEIIEYLTEGFTGTHIDDQLEVMDAMLLAYKQINARELGLKKALETCDPVIREEFEKIKLWFAPGVEC